MKMCLSSHKNIWVSHLASPCGYQGPAALAYSSSSVQLFKTNKLHLSQQKHKWGVSSLISPLFFLSVAITLVGSWAIKCGIYGNKNNQEGNSFIRIGHLSKTHSLLVGGHGEVLERMTSVSSLLLHCSVPSPLSLFSLVINQLGLGNEFREKTQQNKVKLPWEERGMKTHSQ